MLYYLFVFKSPFLLIFFVSVLMDKKQKTAFRSVVTYAFEFTNLVFMLFSIYGRMFLTLCSAKEIRCWQTYSVKVQVVHSFGFGGYMVSGATAQLYCGSIQITIDNI